MEPVWVYISESSDFQGKYSYIAAEDNRSLVTIANFLQEPVLHGKWKLD